MKYKKNFNLVKKLVLCCLAATSIISIGNQTSTKANNNGTWEVYSTDEIKKIFADWSKQCEPILRNKIEQMKKVYGKFPKILILDAGGGYALPDPVTNLNNRNPADNIERRCNDAVALLMQKTIQKLHELYKFSAASKINVETPYLIITFSPADASIHEVHGDKMVDKLTILPEIPQVPKDQIREQIKNMGISDEVYDHFYGSSNRKLAIELFAQQLTSTINSVYEKNVCSYDEQSKKFTFPEKTILNISFQTNNLDLVRNGDQQKEFNINNELNGKGYVNGTETNNTSVRGFDIFYHPDDKQGEQFGSYLKNMQQLIPLSTEQKTTHKLLQPSAEKTMTKLGAEGIPTALYFFDFTDFLGTQQTLFDVDYLGRIAWGTAIAVEKFFGKNPRYSTTEITPVTAGDKTGFLIETTLEGDEIKNIKSGHIVVWPRNATDPNQVVWKDTKLIKNLDGNPNKAKLYRTFIPEKEAISVPEGTKIKFISHNVLGEKNDNKYSECGINIYGDFEFSYPNVLTPLLPHLKNTANQTDQDVYIDPNPVISDKPNYDIYSDPENSRYVYFDPDDPIKPHDYYLDPINPNFFVENTTIPDTYAGYTSSTAKRQLYIPTNINNAKFVVEKSPQGDAAYAKPNEVIYNKLAREAKQVDNHEFGALENALKQLAKEKNLDL